MPLHAVGAIGRWFDDGDLEPHSSVCGVGGGERRTACGIDGVECFRLCAAGAHGSSVATDEREADERRRGIAWRRGGRWSRHYFPTTNQHVQVSSCRFAW